MMGIRILKPGGRSVSCEVRSAYPPFPPPSPCSQGIPLGIPGRRSQGGVPMGIPVGGIPGLWGPMGIPWGGSLASWATPGDPPGLLPPPGGTPPGIPREWGGGGRRAGGR